MNEWMTVRSAALELGVGRSRVYALISNGTLASKLDGLTRMVARRSVEAYRTSPARVKYLPKPRRVDTVEEARYTAAQLEALGQQRLEGMESADRPTLAETTLWAERVLDSIKEVG